MTETSVLRYANEATQLVRALDIPGTVAGDEDLPGWMVDLTGRDFISPSGVTYTIYEHKESRELEPGYGCVVVHTSFGDLVDVCHNIVS